MITNYQMSFCEDTKTLLYPLLPFPLFPCQYTPSTTSVTVKLNERGQNNTKRKKTTRQQPPPGTALRFSFAFPLVLPTLPTVVMILFSRGNGAPNQRASLEEGGALQHTYAAALIKAKKRNIKARAHWHANTKFASLVFSFCLSSALLLFFRGLKRQPLGSKPDEHHASGMRLGRTHAHTQLTHSSSHVSPKKLKHKKIWVALAQPPLSLLVWAGKPRPIFSRRARGRGLLVVLSS